MISYKDLVSIIKDDFPEQAIDLTDCLDLALITLDATVVEIQSRISAAIQSRDFSRVKDLTNLAETINRLEVEMAEIKQNLEPDEMEVQPEDSKSVNYEEYKVDSKIPHTLYEDFSHKRPHAIEFNNKRIEVKTWLEVLLETCNVLISKDQDLFHKLSNDPKMKGKKSAYLTEDPNLLRKPVKLKNTTLYIESNLSANSIRNLIVKMLQKYGIKASEFLIYLRADYSRLHQEKK
jgi:hypothetical protein